MLASLIVKPNVGAFNAAAGERLKSHQDILLELLDEHGRSLHRLLGRLTRCEHATSDLMQELFIRLSQSGGSARARDLYAYAWRTAMNLAFEWRRRQKITSVPLDQTDLPDESRPGGLAQAMRNEQIERLLEATAKLEEPARSVVVMRFIEQQSYEQIAERLGKKPAHLRSLCSKSLARLRSVLSENDSACGSEWHHD
jgi:RNA polymerase sigma-70 factor (ECF subfamily)